MNVKIIRDRAVARTSLQSENLHSAALESKGFGTALSGGLENMPSDPPPPPHPSLPFRKIVKFDYRAREDQRNGSWAYPKNYPIPPEGTNYVTAESLGEYLTKEYDVSPKPYGLGWEGYISDDDLNEIQIMRDDSLPVSDEFLKKHNNGKLTSARTKLDYIGFYTVDYAREEIIPKVDRDGDSMISMREAFLDTSGLINTASIEHYRKYLPRMEWFYKADKNKNGIIDQYQGELAALVGFYAWEYTPEDANAGYAANAALDRFEADTSIYFSYFQANPNFAKKQEPKDFKGIISAMPELLTFEPVSFKIKYNTDKREDRRRFLLSQLNSENFEINYNDRVKNNWTIDEMFRGKNFNT